MEGVAMRGPIDYILVGFEGNKFDGNIMGALTDALDKGVIGLVALSVITKDSEGNTHTLDVASDNPDLATFMNRLQSTENLVTHEDVLEVADLIENNTSCGLLVVEHLWAIPLKEAIVKANGVLIADGRIHPDAAQELN